MVVMVSQQESITRKGILLAYQKLAISPKSDWGWVFDSLWGRCLLCWPLVLTDQCMAPTPASHQSRSPIQTLPLAPPPSLGQSVIVQVAAQKVRQMPRWVVRRKAGGEGERRKRDRRKKRNSFLAPLQFVNCQMVGEGGVESPNLQGKLLGGRLAGGHDDDLGPIWAKGHLPCSWNVRRTVLE